MIVFKKLMLWNPLTIRKGKFMQKDNFSGKVAVIGAGNVGATIAYTLFVHNLCTEIVIIDVAKEKAVGEALDISHGTPFVGPVRIREGEYADCADADVIIVTAGVGRKPGQTRIDLAKINVDIAKDIAKSIRTYNPDPLIIAVSNPVDIITYVLQKEIGMPAHRCISAGTLIDTARLRCACASALDMDVRDMHVNICGEHGDTMFAVWSCASVAGAPLAGLLKNAGVDPDELLTRTAGAGAEIVRRKGATYYGIASAAARIVSAIMRDERAVLTVGKVQEGEYPGVSGVALSLPYIVDRNGIAGYVPIAMHDTEKANLLASAKALSEVLRDVYTQEG